MSVSRFGADFIERLQSADTLEAGREVLREAAEAFDIQNVAYLSISSRTSSEQTLVATTYSDAWQRHYIARRFVTLDPVVAAGSTQIAPFDWGSLDRNGRALRDFFAAAREHGIGDHGLTFPFRGPFKGFGMMSLNYAGAERSWSSLRRLLVSDFMPAAYFFNVWARSLRGSQIAARARALSDRERECLRWCAAGKTIWDVSIILGVSERTVRFHLNNARRKLGAVSTTQAVAQAIYCGAIDLP